MDGSPPGFSVHGILQARIMEWVAMSSSKSQNLRFFSTESALFPGCHLACASLGRRGPQRAWGNTRQWKWGSEVRKGAETERCGIRRGRWSDDGRAISSTCPGWGLGGPSLQPARQVALRRWKRKTRMSCSTPMPCGCFKNVCSS